MGVNDGMRAPAVPRAVAILDLLAHRGSLTATVIARETGIAKSSAADLLGTMLDAGLVLRRADEFTIGPLLAELNEGYVGDPGVLDRFASHWPRQTALSEHTVSIQAVMGTQSFCVDVRLGRFLLPYTPRAGNRTAMWNPNGTGEPQLRALEATDVLRSLASFAGFSPGPQLTSAMREWLEHNAIGEQLLPLRAHTGNREFSVAIARCDPDAPPITLTLHLPARRDFPELDDLRAELIELAQIVGAPSPTPDTRPPRSPE